MTTQPIGNPHHIHYLNANNCTKTGDDQNGTYPLNKDVIWQIAIPKDYVAYVVLTNFHLEQSQNGSCLNDFVSIYTNSDRADKLCSYLGLVRRNFTREGLQRLTIKFQSNEAINEGGFSGAIWLAHRDSTWT